MNSLRGQLGARVSVELDAAPSIDLNSVLSDIREEYENLMDRNLRDVEAMFLARVTKHLHFSVLYSHSVIMKLCNKNVIESISKTECYDGLLYFIIL